MAEHVLHTHNMNHKKIPMVFIRPSIFGAAHSEPVPGWTDSLSFAHGATLACGLGVFTDVHGDPDLFFDIIPVDFVVKQLLVSIPYI
jgi:hypothetical protein